MGGATRFLLIRSFRNDCHVSPQDMKGAVPLQFCMRGWLTSISVFSVSALSVDAVIGIVPTCFPTFATASTRPVIAGETGALVAFLRFQTGAAESEKVVHTFDSFRFSNEYRINKETIVYEKSP